MTRAPVARRNRPPRPERTCAPDAVICSLPAHRYHGGKAPALGHVAGAAACMVTTSERAAGLGLTPVVRMAGWAVGVASETMGIGPVLTSSRVLDRLGLFLVDMDVIELNEAFAAQTPAVLREWGLDPETQLVNPTARVSPWGHLVGATGGRILAITCGELEQRMRHGGLETMCIGGGHDLAAVFERD